MKNSDVLDAAAELSDATTALAVQKQGEAGRKLQVALKVMEGICLMCGDPATEGSRFCCIEDRDFYDTAADKLRRRGMLAHDPASGLPMLDYLDLVQKFR